MSEDESNLFSNASFSERVSLFQKKADQHQRKQLDNPFSHWEGAGQVHKIDKNDENYGKPVEGSKTHLRGVKAHEYIMQELKVLCDVINTYGQEHEDGTVSILFGHLFQIYTKISDKVVGMLLRARKHGYVHFEGEMLFQRRDDDVPIYLIHMPSD